MIRKFLTVTVLTASLFAMSCNDTKGDKSKDKDKEVVSDDDEKKPADEDDNDSDIKKAAAGYCDCFNEQMGEIDPKVKRIVIKASKSNNPTKTIQTEVMNIEDKEEQQQMTQELQKFGQMDGADACTKKVAKKYSLNENDKKVQRQLLNALEENGDCEVVAALMRIGLAQGTNTSNDNVTDEE